MRRLGFAALVCSLLVAVMLALASHPLWAQDSTVVDRTGPFGPAIDYYFPIVLTFLQSLAVKLIAKGSSLFRSTPLYIKWGVLFLVGLAVSKLALFGGFQLMNADAHSWTVPGVLSAIGTVVSGLIYRFGGHQVKALEPNPQP